MILRLLKLDETHSFPQICEHYRPDAGQEEQTACFLLEQAPPDLLESLAHLALTNQDLLKLIRIDGEKLIFILRRQYLGQGVWNQPISDRLAQFFEQILTQIKNFRSPSFKTTNRYGLNLSRVQIIGILNLTPDSFFDGGNYPDVGRAVAHALAMIEDGATVIDIGGESSRPGSAPVSEAEEIRRVVPVIKELRRRTDCLISIDTTKAAVADRALGIGANWINDISALKADPQMTAVALKYDCPLIIMHMLGTPQMMQQDPRYKDVCLEVDDFFADRLAFLERTGIKKIILDPGIGFGKRLEDNLDLIKGAELFRRHGYPLLFGTSRKSFIGLITGREVEQRLAGTLATLPVLLAKGVNLLRVHDVAATKDVIEMTDKICRKI